MTIGKKCYSSTVETQGDAAEFTRAEVEQRIAVAYHAGFNAGYEWAKEGGIRRARERAARDKPANPAPLTRT